VGRNGGQAGVGSAILKSDPPATEHLKLVKNSSVDVRLSPSPAIASRSGEAGGRYQFLFDIKQYLFHRCRFWRENLSGSKFV
jgi:hypothetical protein